MHEDSEVLQVHFSYKGGGGSNLRPTEGLLAEAWKALVLKERSLRVLVHVLRNHGDAAYFAVVAPECPFEHLHRIRAVDEDDFTVVHFDFERVFAHYILMGFGRVLWLIGTRNLAPFASFVCR